MPTFCVRRAIVLVWYRRSVLKGFVGGKLASKDESMLKSFVVGIRIIVPYPNYNYN